MILIMIILWIILILIIILISIVIIIIWKTKLDWYTHIWFSLYIVVKSEHGLDFPKSNLDAIQIQINGLGLKSISTLTRSNIFGFF